MINPVISQLQEYKRVVARIKILEKYPIGAGISIGSIYADDKLQDLHRELRDLPSYMYLSKREQELETTAHAYLTKYPLGVRSQLHEVRRLNGADSEDEKKLRELERKIEKILAARVGKVQGFEGILERISELQELGQQKDYVDYILDVLEEYKPGYGRLLRLRYIEDRSAIEVASELKVVRKTLTRWTEKALSEYARISDMSHQCPKVVP